MSHYCRVLRKALTPQPAARTEGGAVLGKTMRLAALLVAGMLAALLAAGPASASAAPLPFTMADQVNFDSGVFTFTATSPLCASGTFVDDVNVAAFARSEQARSGGGILLIRSVYTCGDGSGTFDLLKHLTLRFTETGFTTAGPLEILSGTGAYAAITGHGFGSGESVGAIGGGTETGVVRLP
jgi:hypothetical protein